MTTSTTVPAFDYTSLDAETRTMVKQRSTEIKTLVKRAADDIIDIGTKLLEVKERVGHGRFGAWVAAEFDWSESTALKMMQVAEAFKSVTVTDLNIGTKALYALAAPSTPESARQEAVERARGGESITYTTAQQIVGTHTQPKPAPQSGSTVGKSAVPAVDQRESPTPPRPSWAVFDRRLAELGRAIDALGEPTATARVACGSAEESRSEREAVLLRQLARLAEHQDALFADFAPSESAHAVMLANDLINTVRDYAKHHSGLNRSILATALMSVAKHQDGRPMLCLCLENQSPTTLVESQPDHQGRP